MGVSTSFSLANYGDQLSPVFCSDSVQSLAAISRYHQREMASRPVTPYDIAPTLAASLGVKPPSGSIGKPLVEVLK